MIRKTLRPLPGIGLACVVVFVLTACAGLPHKAAESRYIADSFGFVHAGRNGAEEKDFLASLGANLVREDFYWFKIQPEPGPFDFSFTDEKIEQAKAANVDLLAILDYDTPWLHDTPDEKQRIDEEDLPIWLNYVETMAKRYGDQVIGFEIWNEPNFDRFWSGSDEDFFTLTAETVKVLRRVSPDTPIYVGALILHPIRSGARFLEKLLKSGAADQADGISVHCYGITAEAAARRLEAARDTMDAYGFDGELWVTEIGLPTGGSYPYAVAPEDQGAHIARWIPAAYAAGADRLIWYELYDGLRPEEAPPGTSSEAFFGVAYPDFELKTGGEVIKRLIPDIRGSRWAPDFISSSGSGIPSAVYPFELGRGRVTAVAWSKIGRPTVTLEGFPYGAEIYETANGKEWIWNPGDTFTLNPEPIIIKGRSKGDIGFRRP